MQTCPLRSIVVVGALKWQKNSFMKIGAWNLYGRVGWCIVSNKVILNKIACFLGDVSPFSKNKAKFSQMFGFVWVNKLKEFCIFKISIKANTASVVIFMEIPFLVLVNIGPSHFLLPVFFCHKLYDKIILWRIFFFFFFLNLFILFSWIRQ